MARMSVEHKARVLGILEAGITVQVRVKMNDYTLHYVDVNKNRYYSQMNLKLNINQRKRRYDVICVNLKISFYFRRSDGFVLTSRP